MHEFSICQTLVSAVLKELGKANGRGLCLKKVNVAAGQYHGIVPASLKLAYKILTKDTPAEGSTLKIRNVPVKIACGECAWRGAIGGIVPLCRKCGSGNVEIIGGRDLFLESIEVVEGRGPGSAKGAKAQRHKGRRQ